MRNNLSKPMFLRPTFLRGSIHCAIVLALVLSVSYQTAAQQPQRIAGAGTLPSESSTAKVDVLTRSYDIGRTGSNVREKVLTPGSVSQGLQKLFTLDIAGDAQHPDDPRLEAQPLLVTGLTMNDGRVHDVVFVCTMQNNIWTFDANTGEKIWPAPISLGHPINPKLTPVPGIPTRSEIDMWGINIAWGILSTPVIDRERETMYVVNWTSPTGSIADSFYQLHALNLADGKEREHSPVKIEATYTSGAVTALFKPTAQKQRSALLLLPAENSHMHPAGSVTVLSGHGAMSEHSHAAPPQTHPPTLIIACGQFGENADGQHGWVLAYDPITLVQTAAFSTTPGNGGGGIWQAGQGPAADLTGDIYATASNGGWNGTTDFAETVLMLHYTPPTAAGSKGILALRTWFTPFLDATRLASEPVTGYDFRDQDLGSAGPVVPPNLDLVFASGKDGVLYVLRKGEFGDTNPKNILSKTRFDTLASPPIFFTYFHGLNVDATDTTVLDSNFGGKTRHLHASPLFWNSPDLGSMLFCWGENEALRAWTTDSSGKVVFRAKGREIASAGAGRLGGMLALSADRETKHTGIVWATVPLSGDENHAIVEGILRAYDATEFSTDPGSSDPVIKLLWDSKNIPGNTFLYDKFCPPVIANGKVYVATYNGRIDVYGLGKP